MTKLHICWLLLALTPWAWAQGDAAFGLDSVSQERQRIATTRSSGYAALDVEDAECQKKFAVFDCQRDVAARRRALDAELKRQENSLNDAERKQRGAEQLERIEQKQLERAQSESIAQPTTNVPAQATPKTYGPTGQARASVAKPQATAVSEKDKATLRKAYADKQEAARKRKAEREKRLQDAGAVSTPLPGPR
jgi:colicin import membrane protein